MENGGLKRPIGVAILIVFFAAGAVISMTAATSLFFPGSFLEPMWRINPRGREAFATMGPAALLLLPCVSVACALASIGLRRGRRWGYFLAAGILSVNLLGDLLNFAFGTEPRAIIGVPIVILIFIYLSRPKIKNLFS